MPRGWSRSVIRRVGLAGPAGVGFDQVVASAFGARLVGGLAGRPGDQVVGVGVRRPGCSRGSGSAGRGRGRLFDPVGDRAGLAPHVDQLPGGGVGDQQLPAGVLTQCQGAGVVERRPGRTR